MRPLLRCGSGGSEPYVKSRSPIRGPKRLLVSAVVLALLGSGCTPGLGRALWGSSWHPPPVPEVDMYIVDLERIGPGSTPDDVRALLGEAPFQRQLRFDGELSYDEWHYPIRDISVVPLPPGAKAQRQVVRAVVLKIRLSKSGRVEGWGFFNPVTGARLEIRQSLEQADALFGDLCNPPARIELAQVLRPGTTKDEVLALMRWFGALSPAPALCSTDVRRRHVHVGAESPYGNPFRVLVRRLRMRPR